VPALSAGQLQQAKAEGPPPLERPTPHPKIPIPLHPPPHIPTAIQAQREQQAASQEKHQQHSQVWLGGSVGGVSLQYTGSLTSSRLLRQSDKGAPLPQITPWPWWYPIPPPGSSHNPLCTYRPTQWRQRRRQRRRQRQRPRQRSQRRQRPWLARQRSFPPLEEGGGWHY